MQKYFDAMAVLVDWGIENPTEQDIWEAVAEANGLEYSDIMDGDLAEWL